MFYHEWLNSWTILEMTAAQRGAYIQLLCYQAADSSDSIPDNPALLKQVCKVEGEDLDVVLRQFEKTEEGRYRNVKLFAVMGNTEAWRQGQREHGREGGLKAASREPLPCRVKEELKKSKEESIVEPRRSTAQKSPKEKEIFATAKEILAAFSEKSGRKFRGEAHLEAIRGRLRDGNTREEVLQALENGLRRDDLKDHWKVPSSLLRPSNFEKNLYFGQKLTTKEKPETDADVARETGLHVVKGK